MNMAESMPATQYLTCRLGDETFALDIVSVREVLDFTSVTKVPGLPAFMRGVINLRGSVVPVADLRLKFCMTRTESTKDTCVIITEAGVDGETVLLGVLADSVQEVLELDADRIEPTPKLGARLRADFIRGIAKHGDRFIVILDIDRVFSADEVAPVAESGPAAMGGWKLDLSEVAA